VVQPELQAMADSVSIAGVILAGGLAQRMGGGDKCLLPLGGRPLLAHVIARLAPQVDRLGISANGDPARLKAFGLPVLADSVAGYPGPLAGVLAGLDWAAEEGAALLVSAAGDTPFFPADLVAGLQAAVAEAGTLLAIAATPAEGGGTERHPTFGLWPVAMREDLRAAISGGTRRVVDWTEPRGCARAVFHGPGQPFFNINTPADLARAEAMLAASQA
jgi:molybdopterin-guanine dinucleotide biosynthesis protein A